MSARPASVGAAPQPRVLLYVPPSAPQPPPPLYYRPLQPGAKLNYLPDQEYYPGQHFLKDHCVKIHESRTDTVNVDRDCSEVSEAGSVEYQTVPGELTLYQRCAVQISADSSPSQLGESVSQSVDRTSDKELLVNKGLVNYQFVEQGVNSAGLQPSVTVPVGWRRIVTSTSVVYVSPSGTALSNLPQLREYLQTTGTCKCGLPCPLRPETAFSFDPKVTSKPYQAASGAELTKLCNHKRKLLATLQAKTQSPATPPPAQVETKKGPEVTVSKKKMKKRPGFPPNMSMSQVMVQRERPLDFKSQDVDRTGSPGVAPQHGNNGPFSTFASIKQNVAQDSDVVKQETHVQRSNHYLTVSNGWISQQENHNINQKSGQNLPNPMTVGGMPVLGTNGQIIGVNTSYNKQPQSFKNSVSIIPHNSLEQDEKEMSAQNIQCAKPVFKEEESQIFCGLNQPLTPEVMQKINEQQQIFIQQNQKQIEMAMKGFRTQLAENQNKPSPSPNQYMPQGQLVIQNGAVVKTNTTKTPPWQVKRNESNSSSSSLSSISPKPNTDHDDSTQNSPEDANNYSTFSNSDQQAMCSRVPPLPQHYNMLGQQWPGAEHNKKKTKASSKNAKKKLGPSDNKTIAYENHHMRQLQDMKPSEEAPNNNVPSFMDDPSGYLAQQTVLLNNTISKQVGINSTYDGSQYESSNNCYAQGQIDKSCKIPNKPCEVLNAYRSNNVVPNCSPSPHNTPDSSLLPDKVLENVPQCCKGCNISVKGQVTQEYSDGKMRFGYLKQNSFKMEMESNLGISSPKHNFDDNPVTSSTFIERSPMSNDSCNPIQAGTVSTSNVSPVDLPEPSPTLSNSSRNTDTPHSSGSNNSQIQSNCTFPMQGQASSHMNRDFNNPMTRGPSYQYNSTGPPNSQSISGTQIMHFISNHNVNKNLMEVDNISMVGIKPGIKAQELYRSELHNKRPENIMPGYCPPPHMGGGPAHSLIQACYVQTFVTTMASGLSVTRDTVTSVLAGKANTATTSINASYANFIRPPPPPSVNLATTYAIPNNQPDPFLNSVNLPTSYPLHIAGTTAQNMISKSPLEMVQNVIGSMPSKHEQLNNNQVVVSMAQSGRRRPTTPGQILISSTGQIIVSNSPMPPPPPKTSSAMSANHGSGAGTNVTTSITQVMPAVPSMINQQTVVVNTLPAPFVLQPPMMLENNVLPQLVNGGLVSNQSSNDNTRQIDVKSGQSFVQGVAMISPESLKKRGKKKRSPNTSITNVLQIAAPQQNPNNIMVHSSPPNNTSPQFSPRGFQLSPNNNISPTPMLQALTIVPGKSGTPAHIVMNGQGTTNNFGSQQIIANTSPTQQINLLQPVNLINNASGVMPNFPAFQQFIVPNLGGMMMTADGTAIIQDNSTGVPMQLQLQTVNGQNVLTPVQNSGVFTGSNGGVVIRAQNQQGKIIQSQHSPGAQFLSPNNQVMMSSPNFNGQLSPLLANLSPTNVTFNTSPHQVRSGNVQTQEFIQTNQMGQTVMVPLSPKPVSIASAANRTNSTFVQQNTTIVQHQTTLVSNSQTQMSSISTNLQGGNSRLSIDPNMVLTKQISNQKRYVELPAEIEEIKEEKTTQFLASNETEKEGDYAKFMTDFMGHSSSYRHSVSTQTLVNQQRGGKSPNQIVSGSSPPDTTTHSPLGPLEASASPRLYSARCVSTQGNYADTTTKSPEPADANSSAMVQCVSSSEQDIAESRDNAWPSARPEFSLDNDTPSTISNMQMMRQHRTHHSVESTDIHYTQNLPNNIVTAQHNMPIAPTYYERQQSYKRKNEFTDGAAYRMDKIMRTNYNMVHGLPKDSDFDNLLSTPDKQQVRHFRNSGPSIDTVNAQKVYDRRNLGHGNDVKSEAGTSELEKMPKERSSQFDVGDLVWGPVKGYASWPGKLIGRTDDGKWNVKWFGGDKAPGYVEDARLLTLSEGLEAHHAARTKHRKSRKLNTLLENAIQEAMAELDKKTEAVLELKSSQSTSGEDLQVTPPITETPKRLRKQEKNKKDKTRKHSLKVAAAKSSDISRLRSSR